MERLKARTEKQSSHEQATWITYCTTDSSIKTLQRRSGGWIKISVTVLDYRLSNAVIELMKM